MKQFEALISLLDDSDKEVVEAVTGQFIKEGLQIIPQLEKIWERADNTMLQERLENVIHSIQFNITIENLSKWVKDGGNSLVEGVTYIAQSQFPGVQYDYINGFFERMKSEFTTDLRMRATAMEKMKIMNYVVFHIYQFSRNTQNFYSPQNSYINQVIETRKGSPLSLAIIFLLIAEKLELPIYGINFPNGFLIAYQNEFRHIDSDLAKDDVLFYANPYNKGAIVSHKDLEFYLKNNNIEYEERYFTPCTNIQIVQLLLSDLLVAYEKLGYLDKMDTIRKLIKVF